MKTEKKFLALILALAMVFTLCVPAFAESTPSNVRSRSGASFVLIGDSMSYDFVLKNNYLDPMDVYGEQAARAAGMEYTEKTRLPGGRMTDAYTQLSDYEGDDYFIKDFKYDLDTLSKEEYQDVVSGADVLTMQLGYSGLSIYVLNNISRVFEGKDLNYSTDLRQLASGDEFEKIMPFAEKCIDLARKVIGENTITAFREYIMQLSDDQKQALNSLLGQNAVDALSGIGDSADKIIDTLIYFMAAHIIHFDLAIERILALNPDVELYVMGLTDPVGHITVSFTLRDLSYEIPLGDILGVFFRMMNLYMKVLSPYSTQYYFVDNISHADCFGEMMARDIDCTRNILYTYYNNECWSGHENTGSAAYKKADARAYGVMKALQNTQNISLTELLTDLPDDLSSLSISADETALDKLTAEYIDENGELTTSYIEQIMAHAFLFTMMKGIYVHPTQVGHDAEAPLLIAAMENPTVDPMAIAFHERQNKSELTDAIMFCDSMDEVLEVTVNWLNANVPDDDSPFSFIGSTLNSIASTLLGFIGIIRSFFEKFSWIC